MAEETLSAPEPVPLPAEPYERGRHKKYPMPFKSEVPGRMAVISRNRHEDRGLKLITPFTRAVLQQELHELMLTDEVDAHPGAVVNRTATLGFVEVTRTGLLAWGDELWIGDRLVGEVAGFDLTHFPNHMNILCIARGDRLDGVSLGLKLEDSVLFKLPDERMI